MCGAAGLTGQAHSRSCALGLRQASVRLSVRLLPRSREIHFRRLDQRPQATARPRREAKGLRVKMLSLACSAHSCSFNSAVAPVVASDVYV